MDWGSRMFVDFGCFVSFGEFTTSSRKLSQLEIDTRSIWIAFKDERGLASGCIEATSSASSLA
jgi:hypothetical protein